MRRGYTEEEIKKLKGNPNIDNVLYGNQIEYHEGFKKFAVMMRRKHPELSARQIFDSCGLTKDLVSTEKAKQRIYYWNKNYKEVNEEKKEKPLDIKNNEILLNLLYQMDKLVNILGGRKNVNKR